MRQPQLLYVADVGLGYGTFGGFDIRQAHAAEQMAVGWQQSLAGSLTQQGVKGAQIKADGILLQATVGEPRFVMLHHIG